jgi:hypothetical protein
MVLLLSKASNKVSTVGGRALYAAEAKISRRGELWHCYGHGGTQETRLTQVNA